MHAHIHAPTQVRLEWKRTLPYLTDEQRRAVLGLASVAPGAAADGITDRGLWRYLQPHLQRTAQGRYQLKDANYRQLLRVRPQPFLYSCAMLLRNVGTAR